jgi:DNA mismatch repair protein MutL
MAKIQKLPEELIRLIAAGEVIERPASVLKELVENSLDAGATQIAIDIWGAGRSRIRVSDNGEGMSKEDAKLALERHATSKLQAFEDLQKLTSFGFRGEALPSIAAVSRMELTTRERDSQTSLPASRQGWRFKLDGGKMISSDAVGVPPGTTIDVQDLFFNTPARAKFMKRDSTERAHILKTVQELALAHPRTSFEISVEGKAAMLMTPAVDVRSRIRDLWDTAITDTLVPIEFKHGSVAIHGFINNVPSHQPTKSYQHLFVNNRPVQQRVLTHAIYEAYHEWLPVGRHPVFMLFLEIDPTVIDINVHPSKREIRFSNDLMLYDLLFHQIRKVLQERQGVPVVTQASSTNNLFQMDLGGRDTAVPVASDGSSLSAAEAARLAGPMMASMVADALPTPKKLDGSIQLLGQFQKVYVLAEQGDDLLLIDQHAAAERVLYEKLLKQSKLGNGRTQPLLTPYVWDVPPYRVETVRDAQEALQQLGFVLEPFGGNSLVLKECPAVFPQLKHAKRFLDVFIESLEEEAHDHEEAAAHETVARAACRAAIKANDPLALPEMQHLLKELAACERPMTCPHGRPTHIRLPLSELHRRFRRT